MKKFVAMIMAILMLSALIGPSAYSEEPSGFTNPIASAYNGTTLSISGTGKVTASDVSVVPTGVETIVLGKGIDEIADGAFADVVFKTVKHIVIKNSVMKIGSNVLNDAATLEDITIPCTMNDDNFGNVTQSGLATKIETVHDDSQTDSLEKVEKQEATYFADGMEAHYKCNNKNRGCKALFKTNKTTPTTEADLKIAQLVDTTAPVITKAPAVSPSGVNKGASAIVIVYASDTESGLADGKGTYKSSVTFANTADPTKTVTAGLNLDEGYLTGSLFFQKDATPGEYKLNTLTIFDAVGNKKEYTAAEVESALGSSVPTVSVSEHTMTHHDRVEPTYYKTGTIEYWQCEDCGKRFSDALGNTEVTDISIPMLTDTTPPVFDNIIPESTNITPSQNVGVTVTAHDEGIGIKGGSVTFTNLAKSDSSPVTAELKLDGDSKTILKGTLTFPVTAASGDYYVTSLTLEDELGNSTTYTNSTLPKAYQEVKITVKRWAKVGTVGTLSLNATSLGYGGTATGTIILKDANGNVLANKTLDIYEGTVKYTTAKTDDTGTATFQYTNKIPGTYAVKAMFNGDEDYNACTTNIVNVTFTSVPATGDGYDVLLWVCVGALAIGVNVWFFLKRKKA